MEDGALIDKYVLDLMIVLPYSFLVVYLVSYPRLISFIDLNSIQEFGLFFVLYILDLSPRTPPINLFEMLPLSSFFSSQREGIAAWLNFNYVISALFSVTEVSGRFLWIFSCLSLGSFSEI